MTSPPRRTVLVVDDDIDIREIVGDVLTDAGYSVVTASNGLDAIEHLSRIAPALILLDLNMPIMDGAEFRRRQLSDATMAFIPTVIMSAVHRMEERVAELRADAVLAKPVNLRLLLETVARHAR